MHSSRKSLIMSSETQHISYKTASKEIFLTVQSEAIGLIRGSENYFKIVIRQEHVSHKSCTFGSGLTQQY